MRKKISIMAAAILAAASLAACSGGSANSTTAATTAAATEAKTDAAKTDAAKTDGASSEAAATTDWPKSAITMNVPAKAGGGTDLQVRYITTAWQKTVGASVAVENFDNAQVGMETGRTAAVRTKVS